MRWVFVIAAGIAATGSASAMECGVFTDSAHAPGKVVAELGADAMTIRAAPDFEYRYVLEPQKAGEDYRSGWTETDDIGGVRVRKDGDNLLLEIGDGMVDEAGNAQSDDATTYHKAVYVPFCPAT